MHWFLIVSGRMEHTFSKAAWISACCQKKTGFLESFVRQKHSDYIHLDFRELLDAYHCWPCIWNTPQFVFTFCIHVSGCMYILWIHVLTICNYRCKLQNWPSSKYYSLADILLIQANLQLTSVALSDSILSTSLRTNSQSTHSGEALTVAGLLGFCAGLNWRMALISLDWWTAGQRPRAWQRVLGSWTQAVGLYIKG